MIDVVRPRAIAALAALALLALVPSAGAAPVTQWDQANDGLLGPNNHRFPHIPFTPALNGVDTVQLCVAGDAAQVAVQIKDSNGDVLGTSSTETTLPTVPNDPLVVNPTAQTFEFSTPVALTPGAEYAIEMVTVAGVAWAYYTGDPTDPFGSGGSPWFREGLGVDPTALDPANIGSYLAAPTCPPSPGL